MERLSVAEKRGGGFRGSSALKWVKPPPLLGGRLPPETFRRKGVLRKALGESPGADPSSEPKMVPESTFVNKKMV